VQSSQRGPGYVVNIHGTVYGMVIGSESSLTMGSAAGFMPPPNMAPPVPPQGVHGRDKALTDIFDLLQLGDDQAREVAPVALRGMGGIGKTTLAVALSRLDLMPQRFPDGVLWVSVGPMPTLSVLLDTWGRALNIDLLPERDVMARRDRLRAALYHRQMLIVVDDVWEVTHGDAFTVCGPKSRLLYTTREGPVAYTLTTRERTIAVDVLAPEAALNLLATLAPEAVQSDLANARRLCERLEYLPLALTLAGRLLANEADVPSRMSRLLGELIEKRSTRLRLLQAEGRPGIDLDQPVTLQAILGMSVERLDPVDRERFAMASLFGGDPLTWDMEAATAVWACPPEEAEQTMARLIQRGLVERRIRRYWMHALLADYAAEMMEQMGL
jgi:hypothetical protein